jgi:hypothetical protein
VLILGAADIGVAVTQLTMPVMRESRKYGLLIAYFMQVWVS